MDKRKKRIWLRVGLGVMLAPGLYVLSFGPACWLCSAGKLPLTPVGYLYWPLVDRAWNYGFGTQVLSDYAEFWNPRGSVIGDLLEAVARS